MNIDIGKLTKEAARVLKGGGIIVYPTETVYGLGGNALDEDVVKKIYNIKGREEGKPLIVLVRNLSVAGQLADLGNYKTVLEKYWPGALTGVFNATAKFPVGVISKGGTVALRVSPHPFIQRLFEHIDFPLISTSANRSGDKNSLSIAEAKESLGWEFDLVNGVVDLGNLPKAVPSTVVDFTTIPPKILRRGSINFSL